MTQLIEAPFKEVAVAEVEAPATQIEELTFEDFIPRRKPSDVEDIIAQYAILAASLKHADANGTFTATDDDFVKWTNDVLDANESLDTKGLNLLRALAMKDGLPKQNLDQLMSLAESGLGLHDLKKIVVAYVFMDVAMQYSTTVTERGQGILAKLADKMNAAA